MPMSDMERSHNVVVVVVVVEGIQARDITWLLKLRSGSFSVAKWEKNYVVCIYIELIATLAKQGPSFLDKKPKGLLS